jgi:endonuclease YncB( thermonuclease family)
VTRPPVLAVLACLLVLPAAVSAATVRGRVASIKDGDTATFTVKKRARTYNLLGVAAPRAGDCFARESAHALKKMLPRDTSVVLRLLGRSAEVKLGSNSINLTMVGSGYARAAEAPGSFGSRIKAAESIAKTSRRGLWAECESR